MFKKDYRRSVVFGRHDLLDDAPISRVDLLACRNTLMYFNHEAQSKIVSRFHFALQEGGYLVLGKAEMLNFADAFAPVDLKRRGVVEVPSGAPHDRLRTAFPAREERPIASGSSNRFREIAFDQDSIAQILVDQRGPLLIANSRA